MKTLMLRQVRLLATPALVSVALGLVPIVGLSFSSDLRVLTASPAEIALALVTIVAPWLIAVAAIAPDAESGGLAFLGGLPLSRARHFGVRTVVALGWSVVAVLPFVLLAGRELHQQPGEYLVQALGFGSLAFVAGLAGGAVARQSLGGFIAAPLLLAVPLGLYEAFAMTMSAPTEFHVAGPIMAGLLLALAGWLGFRDPQAAGSWRPLVRTVGLLLGAVVLGCGATTAAWARAKVFPMHQEEWSTGGPVLVRFSRDMPDWPSANRDWSTTFYPVADLERGKSLDQLGEGWTFDEHLRVVATTPDGHVVAFAYSSERLMLLDVDARKVVAEVDNTRVMSSYSNALRDEPMAQELVGGKPWFVKTDRAVQTFSGEVLHQLPEQAHLQATGGSRLVFRLTTGERLLLDLATGVLTPLDVKGDDAYVVLSPSGRYLTHWSPMSRADGLTFRDLDFGTDVTLTFPEGERPLQNVSMSFAPNDRTVIVTWSALNREPSDEHDASVTTVDHTAAVDLVSGAVVEIPIGVATYWILAWSPSGRRMLTHDGWVDLDVEPIVTRRLPQRDGPVARFVDDDTVLWSTGGRIERIELGR